MSIAETLSEQLHKLIPDKRTHFCNVEAQGGVLQGLATPEFEPFFYRFAAEHKLGLRVTFIEPSSQKVAVSRSFLYKEAKLGSEVVSETIYGDALKVFDREGEFVRVARVKDSYLGWIRLSALSHHLPEPSHKLAVPRAHVFAEPDVSAAIVMDVSLGAKLQVMQQENTWAAVLLAKNQKGYVRSSLLKPIDQQPLASPAAVSKLATRFIDSPYIWGGVTAWGLDCSGLVQTVFGYFDLDLPRDADQQAQKGEVVEPGAIQMGDLLFFPGHVALALGDSRMIHANGFHMRVTIDDSKTSSYAKNLFDQLEAVRRLF